MKQFLVIVVVGVVIAAIPLAVIGINVYALMMWLDVRDLQRNGIATVAVLLAKDASELPRNSTYRFTLRYDATPAGAPLRTLTVEQVVDDLLFKRVPVEGRVKIFYAAAEPQRAHIDGNDIYRKFILYALVGNLLSVIALVALYRHTRRHGRLRQQL